MGRPLEKSEAFSPAAGCDRDPALPNWASLGERIRRAALVATTLHVIQEAGGELDSAAVKDLPREFSGG